MARGGRTAKLLGAAIALVVACGAGEARADGTGVVVAAGVVILVAATDIGLVSYDTYLVAKPDRPSKTYGIVEGVVGAPQALILDGVIAGVAATTSDDTDPAALALIGAVPTFMSIHGFWGTTPNVDPGALYGVSWATGLDTTLTMAALGRGVSGRLSGTVLGSIEVLASAPQVAVASYELATTPHDTAGWAALDVWAGLLTIHGIASVIVGEQRLSDDRPPLPPPPPPLTPLTPIAPDAPTPAGPLLQEPPSQPPPPPSPPESPKAPSGMIVPHTLHVGPLARPGVAGIAIQGALF